MANALTISRIVLSVVLLALPALSRGFLAVYALAGATDMLDGFVAKRTGAASELGARLDSIADFILISVCLVKILPVVAAPIWLWIWIVLIAVVKAANLVSGFVAENHLVMPHTTANRVTGFMLFLVPFAIPFFGIAAPGVPACAVATFAAVQEGHLVRTRLIRD